MFELRPLSYDHPDSQALTERAQDYYVELYGGRDDDPLSAVDLAPPRGGFVVGYCDGEPVAMGGWMFGSGGQDRVAHLRRMFVDPHVRRRGLATAVLAHLEADAARCGATRIILAAGRPQLAALTFYRRHGYTDIPPFGYYADADQVVCLGKGLPAGPAGSIPPTR